MMWRSGLCSWEANWKQIIIFDKVKRDERDQTFYFDDFLKLGEAHPHQAEGRQAYFRVG